ncbi:MAG: hypothetical protein J5J06_12155 [Phycisphaerae bacterium]|nr:hypothetical protein [Phycisphaerae bacterium]
MSTWALARFVGGLPPLVRGAHERFERGGSLREALLVLLTIAAFVAFTMIAGVLMARRARQRKEGKAWQVFGEALENLKLSAGQRRFLRELAEHPRMDNPNVLLLSQSVFERRVQEFAQQLPEKKGKKEFDEELRRSTLLLGTQLREVLFRRTPHSFGSRI